MYTHVRIHVYISGDYFVLGGAAQPSPAVHSSYTSSQGYAASGGGYSQPGPANPPVLSTHSYTHAGHGEGRGSLVPSLLRA